MTIKMIVGLGNPGPKYEKTRHNAGFWFVDKLAQNAEWTMSDEFSALYTKVEIGDENVILVKPQTGMNSSGLAVSRITQAFDINPEELMIVLDELDMPPGHIRLKRSGSTRHNGLKNIIELIQSKDFWRLRFGINHPRNVNPELSVLDYVLSPLQDSEMTAIIEAIDYSISRVHEICSDKKDQAIMALHSKA